jgi:uncharacterized membrane protein
MKKTKGVLLATAVALLVTNQSFAAAPDASHQAKPVKCFGVNSCRGKGQCSGKGTNACAGQNSCKGKGWLYLQANDCQKKGGKIIK